MSKLRNKSRDHDTFCKTSPWITRGALLFLIAVWVVILPKTSASPTSEAPSKPKSSRAATLTPVVLVPGITGTALRDRSSGKIAWGNGARLLSPRDDGYGLAIPIAANGTQPRLEAFRVIEQIRLFKIFKKDVYGPIAERFVRQGYRRGTLSEPAPQDTFFLFAYDWRLRNEETVRLLYEQLEGLRRARGEERLRIDLICQSNGGHICRQLLKYGPATLAEAEQSDHRSPATIAVRRLILVGTANGGSLRILRELDRGRKYVPLGRKIRPETLFTFPSLFQDLPAYQDRFFVDMEGHELDVELYDAATWQKYGWSIFAQKARRRIARRGEEAFFGSDEQQLRYLHRALDEAQRWQRLLLRDVDDFSAATRYYLIQNRDAPTPDRAVLSTKKGRYKLLFTGDPPVGKRSHLDALISAPGDGHATVVSQGLLSPQEKAAVACDPFYVRGDHFELILESTALDRLVSFLGSAQK